ncbi:hypothetical protein [Actinomadura macra]|uniref:hypothetical protein n=1 Tax=Actinomadura macra TaxID=46164 RepID=UPI000836F98D|nr:hypothetical protein [Actinomadura macra]
MSGDLVRLAGDVTQYVTTAASAYRGAMFARTLGQVADATMGFGQRPVQRIFGVHADGEEVPEPLGDVVDGPDVADNEAALRKAIRTILATDTELATQVQQLVRHAHRTGVQVMTSGERSPAVHTNHGIIATGDGNTFQ